MRFSILSLGVFVSTTFAQGNPSSDALTEYTISAENITATFIPYGARLTSLIVPDRDGQDTEVAVGYDDPARYVQDTATNHTYFGLSLNKDC
jgi:aldose 1-epimerase